MDLAIFGPFLLPASGSTDGFGFGRTLSRNVRELRIFVVPGDFEQTDRSQSFGMPSGAFGPYGHIQTYDNFKEGT